MASSNMCPNSAGCPFPAHEYIHGVQFLSMPDGYPLLAGGEKKTPPHWGGSMQNIFLRLNTCKAKVDWSNYHAQQPLHLVLAACKASICFHVLKDIKLILSKLCLGMHKKIHTPYKMERTEYITYYYATINKCHKYLVLHISWSQKKTHTVQYLIFHGNCSNKEDSHRFWAFIYMLPLKPT